MIFAILLGVMVSVPSAYGQKKDCSGQTLTLSTAFKDRYVVKNANSPHDGIVNQNDIAVGFCDGASFDVWTSTGMDGLSNGGREIDVTAQWQNKWLDTALEYNNFAPLGRVKKDVVQPYVVATSPKSFHGITPRVEADYVLVTAQTKRNSTILLLAGMSHAWKMKGGLTLKQDFYGLRDVMGAFHGNPATIGSYSASLAIPYHGVVFQPGVRRTFSFDGVPGKAHTVVFGQISKTFTRLHIFR